MIDKYICIHGHFYQPPRENPWLEEVELQDDAYPYHDWNEKITAECYAPNAASRILDPEGKIIEIVNIYSMISFNFGPTLLSWLERHRRDVYQAILEADRLSMENFSGHGSAMAQAYNHMIMPLASRRDKRTQIAWGIRDFRERFRREPEGMWLPETAVDTETLEMLSEAGIVFTVLSPRQAARVRELGRSQWLDVSGGAVDPKIPYVCKLPSGREIQLFFYDGAISQAIAFGDLLKSGEAFAGRLLSSFDDHGTPSQVVHIATDGETYGHHHRYGDMAIAYCLHYIKSRDLARITNYGEYLEGHPPSHEVEIVQNSAWSCAHGLGRWTDDCGCSTGLNTEWTQAWRRPLRDALDRLRDRAVSIYQEDAAQYFRDPWGSRDEYIDVILDRSRNNVEEFFARHAKRELAREEKVRALKFLEIQRNAMLMYTSCGWFFDDISGIEAIQVMQYASKVMQYIEELKGEYLDPDFMTTLRRTPSNVFDNALKPYVMYVQSQRSDLLRVAAHYGISSMFEEYPKQVKLFSYSARSEMYERVEAGRFSLAIGKAHITSEITWEEKTISFAVLHLGDHNINGGAMDFVGTATFDAMREDISGAFERGDIPEVIRLMDRHFGSSVFSAWHLFRDEQKKILDRILQGTYEEMENSYRQIYEKSYDIMNFFHSVKIRLPRPFSVAAEYVVNRDLKKIFEGDPDLDRLRSLMEEVHRWSIKIDATMAGFLVSSWLADSMEKLLTHPEVTEILERIDDVMEILKPLSLSLTLWKAQNIYFSIGKEHFAAMNERARREGDPAARWVEHFLKMGKYLHVKI
jgi:alpha-amylase/alpha-mannosidase (GH57 family)